MAAALVPAVLLLTLFAGMAEAQEAPFTVPGPRGDARQDEGRDAQPFAGSQTLCGVSCVSMGTPIKRKVPGLDLLSVGLDDPPENRFITLERASLDADSIWADCSDTGWCTWHAPVTATPGPPPPSGGRCRATCCSTARRDA